MGQPDDMAQKQLLPRFFITAAAAGLVSVRRADYNAFFVFADALGKAGRVAAFGADGQVFGYKFGFG